MQTTINNTERVFLVTTSVSNKAFCNLADLNRVVKELGTNEGYFKVYHYWNGKFKKASNKLLREMHTAARLTMDFHV